MIDLQSIKQRFGIVGNYSALNHEIEKAIRIAPTDLTVLITGESGVGKEVFPQIIHQNSLRKHGPYFAVNCGAIPEGTVDSELFGHEKGSFTSAVSERRGYFEVADKGTLFLDEVGELPMATQARLLRVLEYGEFMRVGSSKAQKTDVRIVAATNLDLLTAIRNGKFREDLYYRLNAVSIMVPPLRSRKDDIYLLFRKFAADAAEKYRMPAIHLTDEAKIVLMKYRWPGNIRELKNVAESISVTEQDREISAERLKTYLVNPDAGDLPVLSQRVDEQRFFNNEREILYQLLFDMRKDINELKRMVPEMNKNMEKHPAAPVKMEDINITPLEHVSYDEYTEADDDVHEEPQETMSLEELVKERIEKALARNKGNRRSAAKDLKISERTLYRKIKEYGLE
ncbi:MAG: sigma-54 dependent transcriptional regulator [Dysgonamonadaceae bacterium]|jgi:transcriptional regulator with PAS, ATPase and Fis domain|nr:sigma-54 dependent transcriptional regulator [Dysgonamonadaceae bacterium]